MIAWGNFAVLLFSTQLFLFFYVRSVSLAGQEKVVGPQAYPMYYYNRLVSGLFELIIAVNFVLYHFFPLPVPLPVEFPWPGWVSLIVAALIGIPATTLMVISLRDAGEEALRPKKEHTLYEGIFAKLRHPQAVGEVFLFPFVAILLHSPFLTLVSLIYFPIFIIMCYAEEQDLLLRYGETYAEYCRQTGAFWPKRDTLQAKGTGEKRS